MKYKTYLETAADLNVVFSWLTSSSKSSSELTATVNAAVSNLLEFLDPSVVLDKYWRQLVSILEDHKDPQVSYYLKLLQAFLCNFCVANCSICEFAIYTSLGKCHRRSQIFLVFFIDFASSIVLVSFIAFIFS